MDMIESVLWVVVGLVPTLAALLGVSKLAEGASAKVMGKKGLVEAKMAHA